MDKERMSKLRVYCENLPDDERTGLIDMLLAMSPTDPNGETQFDGTPQRRTLEYKFKRQSPVVVQVNFSKDDLGPVVAYCEQVYSELDGGLSLRFPIEPKTPT